jgi:hypothetical protein
MRTPTQTGIIVGAAAGLLAALIYWFLQGTTLGWLVLILELALALAAGIIAAQMARPGALDTTPRFRPAGGPPGAEAAPTPLTPLTGGPEPGGWTPAGGVAPPAGGLAPPPSQAAMYRPPSIRGQLVRAAAVAGALSGVGWGLAGMAVVAAQTGNTALMSQIESQLGESGLPAGSSTGVVSIVLLCTGCVVLLLFPGICAGVGALGGYILTAIRPAVRTEEL